MVPGSEEFLGEEALFDDVADDGGQELAEVFVLVELQEEVLDVKEGLQFGVDLDEPR